jgi:hypothetical protein
MQARGHGIGRRQAHRQRSLHSLLPSFELRAESLGGFAVVGVCRAAIG